jgi:hypothetical protein
MNIPFPIPYHLEFKKLGEFHYSEKEGIEEYSLFDKLSLGVQNFG